MMDFIRRDANKRLGEFRTLRSLKKHLVEKLGGSCKLCGKELPVDFLHLDHAFPVALGGSDGDEAFQLLCRPCHRAKTAIDIKVIAAARALGYIESRVVWADRDYLRDFYFTNYGCVQKAVARRNAA